jgi:hypothetical protein
MAIEFTFDVKPDEHGIFDGRELARQFISSAFRLLVPLHQRMPRLLKHPGEERDRGEKAHLPSPFLSCRPVCRSVFLLGRADAPLFSINFQAPARRSCDVLDVRPPSLGA